MKNQMGENEQCFLYRREKYQERNKEKDEDSERENERL